MICTVDVPVTPIDTKSIPPLQKREWIPVGIDFHISNIVERLQEADTLKDVPERELQVK